MPPTSALYRVPLPPPTDSIQTFEATDGRFLGLLGSCRWLAYVSKCLTAARDCVRVVTGSGAACVLKGTSPVSSSVIL